MHTIPGVTSMIPRATQPMAEATSPDVEHWLLAALAGSVHYRYLPIFIRLKDELEQKKVRDAALEEDLQLARDNS